MQFIIPITAESIPLIAELNNGMAPEVESVPTYFTYSGPNKFNSIDFEDEIPAEDEMTMLKIGVFNDER